LAGLLPLALLAGCSQSTDAPDPSANSTPTSTPTSDGTTPPPVSPESTEPPAAGPSLDVTIKGNQVSPNSEEVDLARGETMTFVITSDRAGEMHVHAKPEQYLEFGVGKSRLDLVIDTPGVVEVEDHETGNVVALIEVR
ncbi:MAG: hypothetical protein ACLGH4_10395, partial [Actinomycetes bacterium]